MKPDCSLSNTRGTTKEFGHYQIFSSLLSSSAIYSSSVLIQYNFYICLSLSAKQKLQETFLAKESIQHLFLDLQFMKTIFTYCNPRVLLKNYCRKKSKIWAKYLQFMKIMHSYCCPRVHRSEEKYENWSQRYMLIFSSKRSYLVRKL